MSDSRSIEYPVRYSDGTLAFICAATWREALSEAASSYPAGGAASIDRLEIGNMSDAGGASMVRTVPMDTGHEHGPIAEHVRHAETGAPGYLLASYDAGRESLVLWRRSGWLERLPTISTRLDWSAA